MFNLKKTVLILCTGNSCRSQMAEGIARHYFSSQYDIVSAGTKPSFVHPLAIAVMQEIGIDISAYRSKSVDEFKGKPFDFIMTVCGNADQNCPFFPGVSDRIHWGFEDPALCVGEDQVVLQTFRNVRDAILAKFQKEWFERLI